MNIQNIVACVVFSIIFIALIVNILIQEIQHREAKKILKEVNQPKKIVEEDAFIIDEEEAEEILDFVSKREDMLDMIRNTENELLENLAEKYKIQKSTIKIRTQDLPIVRAVRIK